MLVRLIRKLAPTLNGVDLSDVRVGEVLTVPESVGAMLVAEGWAEPAPSRSTDADEARSEGRRFRFSKRFE